MSNINFLVSPLWFSSIKHINFTLFFTLHFFILSMCSSPVDVTLDPVTAAGWLVLSPDGKKVTH